MISKTKVGIIGTGNISSAYLEISKTYDILEVEAVADIDMDRAKAQAEKFGISRVISAEELVADRDIQIVLNLTPPAGHAAVALSALQAGKSVYNEKPLAIQREDAQRMLQLALENGLRIGCAPDTFLGAGLQTCRKLIDEGAIGTPIGATAFMLGHGPEDWHPSPDFFYKAGGGPMFDMGPYYLTALVSLLGPVKRVTGSTRISFAERVVSRGDLKGHRITVETPTHLVGVLDFTSGPVGNIITSFDVWHSKLPCIEIYGSEGTLSVPDPNTFGGPVMLAKAHSNEWEEVPLVPLRAKNNRSVGLADMAYALRSGRPHRANGDMAYHVLDLMHTIIDASREGHHIEMRSTCQRPAPMVLGLPDGELDE
jgi:predicted dehydrogenase